MAEIAAQLPRFDRIARAYRAMEYLSFGPMLERCRFHYLPAFGNARRALVLGDGDGRFVARLLGGNPQLHAEAVDGSAAMLELLGRRVSRAGAEGRLRTACADARCYEPAAADYDLVATHFFLDCLTEREAEELMARLRPRLAPGARWVVSEFRIPAGNRLAGWIVSALYAAFHLLTGLAVRHIPRWAGLLQRHGLIRIDGRSWLGGLLVAELWELP
jgi:ubiquinone/menaquinone biosynthesis C-methylase UbiE